MSMEQGQQQDLTKILEVVKRRKWSILIPFVTSILIAAIICMMLPDIYKSTATILIKSQQIPQNLVQSTVNDYAEQRIQTITQQVTSRSKILGLVEKYDLFPDKREHWTTEDLVDKVRGRITIEPISVEVNDPGKGRASRMTIAFTVSYEDEDPKKAQLVTNELASYYMEMNLESREKYAKGTKQFLEEQIQRVKKKISDLESKMAEFRKQHLEELPEFTNLNMQKLQKLNSDITNINMQLRTLEEQRASMRAQLAGLDPYSGSSSRVMSPSERLQQAKLERAELLAKYSPTHPKVLAKNREIALLEKQAEGGESRQEIQARIKGLELKLSDMKSRYSDAHPGVKALKREIRDLKVQLAKAETAPKADAVQAQPTNPAYISLKGDLDRIAVSIESLKREKKRVNDQIKEIYAKLQAMPDVAKNYNEMNEDLTNAKLHYSQLQQKLLAAAVSESMEENKLGETFQVVEPAFLPETPYKPNRLAIMLIGMVLGLGMGIGLAAIREFADVTIRDAEGLEKVTGVPVLSVISTIGEKDEPEKRNRRKLLAVGAVVVAGILAVVLFHYFVMDLYIFYAKLTRLIQSKV